MSVSNVLNGRTASANMKAKVLHAMEELKYVPNPAARQLASAGPMFIGVLHHSDEHPVAAAILNGALRATSRMHIQLLLEPIVYSDLTCMGEAIARLRTRGAEGCIVTPGYGEWLAGGDMLNGAGIPVVYVGAGDALPNLSTCRIDDWLAAYEVTSMLIHKGHRKIGFIPVPERFSIHHSRIKGYMDALEAHDIAFDPGLVFPGEYTIDEGMTAATALLDLDKPPTAIFASNDEMAAGTLIVAHSRGIAVPNDLAVVGFDDTYIAQSVWPPLTSVRVPFSAMAERAVDEIVHRIRAKVSTAGVQVSSTILEHTIVRRASTGD